MNGTTALLFILAGTALWRVRFATRRPDLVALALGLVVAAFGALQLAHHCFGLSFHPGQLLFPDKLGLPGAYRRSDMAPNTSLAFLLCGSALVLIHCRTRRCILLYQVFTLAVGLIALIALIGYSYHVLLFYGLGAALPMSLESAICFALLSLGLLAARPDQGLMTVLTSETTGGAIGLRLLPMAVVVPWVLGAMLLAGEKAGYWQREFGNREHCHFLLADWLECKTASRQRPGKKTHRDAADGSTQFYPGVSRIHER
jgi:hypothetical protein